MLHILGFIFFIVFIILVIGLILLSKIIRTVLGVGRRMTGQRSSRFGDGQGTSGYDDTQDANKQNAHTASRSRSERKKVFDDDEGEYIDFEEIKD